MRTEFAALRAADGFRVPTLLDTYGATNPAEFFAVATEAFFERPRRQEVSIPRLSTGNSNVFSDRILRSYSSEPFAFRRYI